LKAFFIETIVPAVLVIFGTDGGEAMKRIDKFVS